MVAVLSINYASAIGFDRDDFVVTGFLSNNIVVYDHDLTFKGVLQANVSRPTGLDFDLAGNLVVAIQGQGSIDSQVRRYGADGGEVSSFINVDLGDPLDVKVGPNGNYFIGTQDFAGGNGLREFSPSGTTVRQFDPGDYEGVAIIGADVVWGGGGAATDFLNAFRISTGASLGSISFDQDQHSAGSMYFSRSSRSVLITDTNVDTVFERSADGTFIQSLSSPLLSSPFGVTRGPNGDVFVVDFDDDGVYRWQSDGTYVGFTSLTLINGPVGIVWAGNIVPEPTCLMIVWFGVLFLRRPRRHGCS
jgi:hypothetical protein